MNFIRKYSNVHFKILYKFVSLENLNRSIIYLHIFELIHFFPIIKKYACEPNVVESHEKI